MPYFYILSNNFLIKIHVSKLKSVMPFYLKGLTLFSICSFKIVPRCHSPPFLNLSQKNKFKIMEDNEMSFYVTIINSQGKEIKVKVSVEIFELFKEEQKEIARLRKEKERHASDEDVESDIAGYLHSLRTESLEERAMQRQELKSAVDVIKSCTSVQQRRFYLNRILGYSFTEIARKEHCSEGAVRFSVKEVINKLEKIRK
ncbi:RNA polymerase sigma factor [Anaerotignum propionicum]|uniref:RNA polymerase sigma factor n=1 Tax=Anaerotignum propionicum TaxID=28446 RepID=UPI0028A2A2C5|nr:hypothetical protein [Anaerotignum propionicum]